MKKFGLEVLVAGPRLDGVVVPGGHVLGYVDPDQVIEASDVLLAPALFEAAGVAVGQALSRGVPVVVGPRTHLKLSRSTLESQFASPVSQMMSWSVMVSPPWTGAAGEFNALSPKSMIADGARLDRRSQPSR